MVLSVCPGQEEALALLQGSYQLIIIQLIIYVDSSLSSRIEILSMLPAQTLNIDMISQMVFSLLALHSFTARFVWVSLIRLTSDNLLVASYVFLFFS